LSVFFFLLVVDDREEVADDKSRHHPRRDYQFVHFPLGDSWLAAAAAVADAAVAVISDALFLLNLAPVADPIANAR